jgi:predicted AlkP superfamily pyrophosphatase or phosphodiesterase
MDCFAPLAMTEFRLRKIVLAGLAAILSTQTAAQPASPPRLLIVISVDQLSADLFDEYRPQFTAGFARLASGTVFRNGYQSHATTETCPGHSTILTGDRPARTGIVSNAWGDPNAPRADKFVYCAEDERVPGTTSDHYQLSPVHLRVPTLGGLLKRRSPASRVVAVAGKDRSAVMMTGNAADQRWYWDGKRFATDLPAPVPRSVAATNAALAGMIAVPADPLVPPPFCAARAQPIAIAGHAPVGAGTFARAAGDAAAFRASPGADAAALALSAALVRELGLGRGPSTDVLAVGLAATDYVGHSYGTEGQEMCLQLLSLDRDLGDFFARLDSWGVDYAVALTADHGGLDIPERLRLHGVADAARIDPELTPKAIGDAVAAKTGLGAPILANFGVTGDLYLDSHLRGEDRTRALAAVLAAYRAHPQVAAAFSKDEIARTAMPSGDPTRWSVIQRVRASFDPARSGDLYVVLKPDITPIGHAAGSVATHGSPWDYDRRVPILFWRAGMAASTRQEPVETVDIMPTLAAMIGVPLAAGSIDGKCLQNVPTVACPEN